MAGADARWTQPLLPNLSSHAMILSQSWDKSVCWQLQSRVFHMEDCLVLRNQPAG